MKTALVIGGGEMDPLLLASIHSPRHLVICADRGAEAVREAGIVPDVLIGDMDSISRETLGHFTRSGVRIMKDGSPDHLDTELALAEAVRLGAEQILILGAWGERIDQSMASISFLELSSIPLSRESKDSISFQGGIIIATPSAIIRSVPRDAFFSAEVGTKVALLPLPRAEAVSTTGLQFDLEGESLTFPDCWSVSNFVVEGTIGIRYHEGDLALLTMYASQEALLQELHRIIGTAELSEGERMYHQTLRAIYDHGGISPMENVDKEARLKITSKLLDRFCPEHRDMNIVHIAGTSGKGSVALFLQSILSGRFKTGLLLSPHIHDLNERVQVNREPIPHDRVVTIWNRLRDPISEFEKETGELLLFQEIMLLLAFIHLREQEVEWAIIETGLGGRYDQTRILHPNITAITQIDLDHTHILGSTIPEIAREKAGIIRPGIPLFTSERKQEVLDLFRAMCLDADAPFHPCHPDEWTFTGDHGSISGMTFSHGERMFTIQQVGEHQAMNADLAVSIAGTIPGIQEIDIRNGLDRARLPGRIEVRGKLIIDTAHNPAELRMLHRTLTASLPKGSERVVVCGMADTKDHLAMLREIGDLADILILTRAGYRGEDPQRLFQMTRTLEEFASITGILVEPDPMTAYRLGRTITSGQKDGDVDRRMIDRGIEDGVTIPGDGDEGRKEGGRFLIVTGSTFLVDEIFNPDRDLRRVNSGDRSSKNE